MSGSMMGEPFNEMMAAVRVFVEGNLIKPYMPKTCFTAAGFNKNNFHIFILKVYQPYP